MANREDNLKKIDDEIMSDEELDNVAGGTIGELEDLAVALMKKLPTSSSLWVGPASAHIPGMNVVLGDAVLLILEKSMGIHARLSLGVAGTGFNSEKNTYTEISTGKSLTHKEVIDRINNL